ncbi:SLC39A6 [Cordylochernes scorpioides]|uniref:SLC39A6 n=1 Tax=Cordylochernes scorpioides TaxID=51811 RepID=A0ABY6LWR8_9ARAC|nr:SLC39A6 [Cordylochernes scorpioides]
MSNQCIFHLFIIMVPMILNEACVFIFINYVECPGASFAADISGGISTALAVFCHELPHELGKILLYFISFLQTKRK